MQQLAAAAAVEICSANDRGDELCAIYNNRSLFMSENWMLPLCSLALTSKKGLPGTINQAAVWCKACVEDDDLSAAGE